MPVRYTLKRFPPHCDAALIQVHFQVVTFVVVVALATATSSASPTCWTTVLVCVRRTLDTCCMCWLEYDRVVGGRPVSVTVTERGEPDPRLLLLSGEPIVTPPSHLKETYR